MSQITLDGVVLPSDLKWVDEFEWSPQVRQVDYSLTGALLVQTALKQSGRPITLNGEWAWVMRSVVLTLNAKAAANATYPLVLADGRAFNVIFLDNGVSAEPIVHVDLPDSTHPYKISLKLIAV
ncbi:MAG: hypothetical protein ABL925_07225 [Methylococcales bacterium]